MGQENNIVDFPLEHDGSEPKVQADGRGSLQPVPDPISPKSALPPVALALGGGAARGWAHIGVLRAIDEANVPVSMIAGTSIGALVGGCYLAGKLDELEAFARSISRWNMFRYMDFAVRASGLISGKRLADRMDTEIGHLNVEDLDIRFVAVATDIVSGAEIWLENGSLSQAIRASYALPGVFQPVSHMGRQMADGAIVNPVPVSACRAFEEPIVMAVNLNSEVYGRASIVRSSSLENRSEGTGSVGTGLDHLPDTSGNWLEYFTASKPERQTRLGVAGVMIEAFNIIQDRIARSRLAGDPPDFTIRPKLKGIGLSDFHKADQAIAQGYETAKQKLAVLQETLGAENP